MLTCTLYDISTYQAEIFIPKYWFNLIKVLQICVSDLFDFLFCFSSLSVHSVCVIRCFLIWMWTLLTLFRLCLVTYLHVDMTCLLSSVHKSDVIFFKPKYMYMFTCNLIHPFDFIPFKVNLCLIWSLNLHISRLWCFASCSGS